MQLSSEFVSHFRFYSCEESNREILYWSQYREDKTEKENSHTMADLKFIVSEVNKLIKTDYNMISFDALPIANLVQILVDVLANFGALIKVKIIN